MADYQRFVSYLYEYQNNTKSKNCGFCRVELRDHHCRLEIRLKLPVYPFTPTLKVYVFVPSKEKLYGIFLGNASYQQGNVSGSFSFAEQNIQNSSYHFSQLGGIFIQSDMGICFASAWKDLNIQPEKFSLEKTSFREKSTEPSVSHSCENNNTSCLPTSDAEITPDKPQTESNQSNIEATPAISDEIEDLSRFTLYSTIEEEKNEVSSKTRDTTQNKMHLQNQSKESAFEPQFEPESESEITVESKVPQVHKASQEINSALHTDSDISLSAASTNAATPEPQKELSTFPEEATLFAASSKSSDNFWDLILKSYPQCHPFFDDEIHNCVQLSQNDVQKISSSGYPICNNPFFRHNCQSFQHFLIGRKTCSSNSSNTHYILAVPGIYNPKEQYMASMFGFPYFKCGQHSRYRNNCWGYWYRIIPEHWEDCKF